MKKKDIIFCASGLGESVFYSIGDADIDVIVFSDIYHKKLGV